MKKFFLNQQTQRSIGIFLIIIGISIAVYAFYQNSQYSQITRTFSTYTVLESSWQKYLLEYGNSQGRIIDYSDNSTTTSEAMSYALLREVIIDDKTDFDLSWKWTETNLKQPTGYLFAWQWGKYGKKYGCLPNGGCNSSTDADEDIALALILAGHRWSQDSYIEDARKILPDIYKDETDVIQGKRYVVAGTWAIRKDNDVINVSYFRPASYRIFATIDMDKNDNWNSLIAPSYDLLNKSSNLKAYHGSGVAPDWITLTRIGQILPPYDTGFTMNDGYDAMRVPFFVALDWIWFKDPLALNYLKTNYKIYDTTFKSTGKLPAIYGYDGSIVNGSEDPTRYATALPYFMIIDPKEANNIYQNKIIKLYSNGNNSFDNSLSYYPQNYLWLSTALYKGFFIDYK